MSWSDIRGWFGFRETYDEMVDQCPDGGTLVEIGVGFGRSAAYLARRVIDSGKEITIWAVDPFRDDWWIVPGTYPANLPRPTWGREHAQWAREQGGPFSAFVASMREHAPEELERLNVLRCRSSEAAKVIGLCDGVMIDGDHNYEAVSQDIALWRPHMAPGGIFAGDDYSEADFPGVVRAVKEAFGTPGYCYSIRGTTWVTRAA